MKAKATFRCSIGCEIMLMIKASIRLIFSRYMNEQIRKNNSSTKEENQSKEMGTREVYDIQQQKWVPYISDPDKWYQHLLEVRHGLAERDSQDHYMVGSGRKYRELKEMRQKEKPVLNMVTPVAQVLEMAKSELKQKREDSINGRGHKTGIH